MRLNNRLSLIRDMLPTGRVLCDVGTDHALIPAAAVLDGLFSRAVATDIRPGPLERAAATLCRHALADRIALRLGPGLQPVFPGECDVIVIAGMGALMITGILEASPETARGAKCLLLQPMHAQEKLRPWLRAHGYVLLDECLAEEGNKRYQVLAVRAADRTFPDTVHYVPRPEEPLVLDADRELYDRVGEGIVKRGGPVAARWVADWTLRQRKIVEGLRIAGHAQEAEKAEIVRVALQHCLQNLRDGEE